MTAEGSEHSSDEEAKASELKSQFARHLFPLDRAVSRTRGGVRRFGNKATVLAKFARGGVHVPEAYLLEVSHFEQFLERSLPDGHDLRSLIKLGGSRVGHEHCGRAYETLRASALDEELRDAIHAFWEWFGPSCPYGVAVRPSIAGNGAVDLAGRHLHARVGLKTASDLVDAVVAVWASSVLSQAIAAYVEAGMKGVSVALLLQRVVPCEKEVWLSRLNVVSVRPDEPARGGDAAVGLDWHLGVSVDADRGPWQPRRSQFAPLSLGQGGEVAAPEIEALRRELNEADFEYLGDLARTAEQLTGAEATLQLAMSQRSKGKRFQLINALEGGSWLGLRGGTEKTTWCELTGAMRGHEPSQRLGQSLMERTFGTGLRQMLSSLGCRFDSEGEVLSRWCGRSYLNVSDMLRSVAGLPTVHPRDVLFAAGGLDEDAISRLAAEVSVEQVATSRTRKVWRVPQLGSALLRLSAGMEAATRRELDSINHDGQGLRQMDLTLLPNDAMATTLRDAQRLVERSVSLWLRCAAGQWLRFHAVQTLLDQRIGDVDPLIAYRLCRGVDGLLGPTLASESQSLAEAFSEDEAAAQLLRSKQIRRVEELPDGRARAVLGRFLVRYGNLAQGPFDLSRPRWSEDASDLLAMTRLALDKLDDDVAPPSRVLADRALASFEPELASLERRMLRYLIDKGKDAVRVRSQVDWIVYDALAKLRRVVVDVDRRLRRIDGSIGQGGAFHCSLERLSEALASGRPELGRVIRMRAAERGVQRWEPAPPSSFVASPPRGARQVKGIRQLAGLGVSSGVADGCVRRLTGDFSGSMASDTILVLPNLDPALAPLFRIAGGVVAGTSGAMSLGAEALRELGIPAVASAPGALLELREGESIRLDGGRGQVQRLVRGESL